jgi:hypothetical protein
MTLKLGELLIKEKLVTSMQLEEALKKHVIYGIKLGSSLVEMGYVDEERLSQLLSKTLGVPCADRTKVANPDKEAIGKITRELASKYRMIPFRLEQNRISVAMSDPTNFKAIEEVGFMTNCLVVTYIVPDILISKALAKHYNISDSEIRYHQLAPRNKKKKAAQEPPTVTFPMTSESGELLHVSVPVEFEGFGNLPELPEVLEIYERHDYGNKLERYTIDKLSTEFAAAQNRDEIGDTFIRYLGQEFSAGAIFMLHGRGAFGWRGIADQKLMTRLEQLHINIGKCPVFKEVIESKQHFLGELEEVAFHEQVVSLLTLSQETQVLVMPVIMNENVVAIVLVAINGKRPLHIQMTELEKLVRKMSLAFEKLIIVEKILLT